MGWGHEIRLGAYLAGGEFVCVVLGGMGAGALGGKGMAMSDAVLDELVKVKAENEQLRTVIKGLRMSREWESDWCWCEVAIGNPNCGGRHSPQCLQARKALRGGE